MSADRRRRQLALIHCAARDLGLDRDSYENVLWAVARVRSAADLDEPARRRLIEHFKSLGWEPRRGRRPKPSDDRAPLIRKIDALLAAAGRGREYVERGMLKHMFGPSAPARLEWLTPDALKRIAAALSYDARRRSRR